MFDERRWPNLPSHNGPLWAGWLGTGRVGPAASAVYAYSNGREPGDPRDEADFKKVVDNALSDKSLQAIKNRLFKKCCCITFIFDVGSDKIFSSWIEDAVKTHDLKEGKRTTRVVCREDSN